MSNKIHRKDFDRICRLCLEYAADESTLFPLFINEAKIPGFYGRFLKEFNESIPEVISTCLGIEINPMEKLPMKICSNCEKQLIASNLFRQTCLQSNEYLQRFRLNDDENMEFDTEDDMPLDSVKYPEVVIVDRIKEEEFKQENTDSSCDESEWDNTDDVSYDTELSVGHEAVIDQEMVPHTNSRNNTYAAKRSTTVPLVTPSTPITSNDNEAQEWRPKRPAKYTYAKKPKVCTVCGVVVDRLRDHMRTHPDALEYHCTNCPKKYLTPFGLSKHIKHKHADGESIPQTVTPITNAHLRSLETLKKCRGESYMARDGRFRKAKTIGPVCKQCIFKCTENISDEHRKLLFNNFYNLGSIKKQWEYIGQCTDRVETKYRPTADNSMRKRSERNLLAYYFELDFGRVRVCKTFLMNTLAISNSVIKTVLRKLNENGELMSGDRRGNYDRRRLYNKSN